MSAMKKFSRRACLWSFFSLWALIALARGAYFAGPGRAGQLKKSENIALKEGVIPAERGTLFDRNGVPLAWDEAYFELVATDRRAFDREKELSALLKRPVSLGPGGVLVERLSPADAEALDAPLRAGFPAKIRFRRVRVFCADVSRRTEVAELEKRYDDPLRGRDGRYRVMIDRFRGEIPGSYRLVEAPLRGEDVVTDISPRGKGEK